MSTDTLVGFARSAALLAAFSGVLPWLACRWRLRKIDAVEDPSAMTVVRGLEQERAHTFRMAIIGHASLALLFLAIWLLVRSW